MSHNFGLVALSSSHSVRKTGRGAVPSVPFSTPSSAPPVSPVTHQSGVGITAPPPSVHDRPASSSMSGFSTQPATDLDAENAEVDKMLAMVGEAEPEHMVVGLKHSDGTKAANNQKVEEKLKESHQSFLRRYDQSPLEVEQRSKLNVKYRKLASTFPAGSDEREFWLSKIVPTGRATLQGRLEARRLTKKTMLSYDEMFGDFVYGPSAVKAARFRSARSSSVPLGSRPDRLTEMMSGSSLDVPPSMERIMVPSSF